MPFHDEQFFDPEDPAEINEDPCRCPWCRKPLDMARLNETALPEDLIFEGASRMRAHGRELEEALDAVRAVWEREEH